MAVYRKEYKSRSEKRHNINLTQDDVQRSLPYGWMASYNQRALLVRILCAEKSEKIPRQIPESETFENIKFITNDDEMSHEGIGYLCKNISDGLYYSLDNFYILENNPLKQFHRFEMESEKWKTIVNCIELLDYKYEMNEEEEVVCWSSSTDLNNNDLATELQRMSEDQKSYLAAFGGAMKCDMTQGQGQWWMNELVKTIIHCNDDLSGFDVRCFSPSHSCKTNTVIELISNESPVSSLHYRSPYSSDSPSIVHSLSTLSSESSHEEPAASVDDFRGEDLAVRHTIVPDFCVMLPDFPGRFPLVVKLTPAQNGNKALEQNLLQMLSKLFFQHVVFGMVISPTQFQLTVIIKKQGDVHFASTHSIPLIDYKDGVHKLDLVNLNTMCTFIYHVLMWAKESHCMLE